MKLNLHVSKYTHMLKHQHSQILKEILDINLNHEHYLNDLTYCLYFKHGACLKLIQKLNTSLTYESTSCVYRINKLNWVMLYKLGLIKLCSTNGKSECLQTDVMMVFEANLIGGLLIVKMPC